MSELSKILCPIDFSERSPAAARYAGALACHFHSELTLLNVIDPGGAIWVEAYAPMLDEILKTWRERAEQDMAGFLRDLPSNVKRVVLSGNPALKIAEYAHQERINLIVIPTHGYGPFRRFLLGSVTAKILHDVECPVLTGVHIEVAPVDHEFRIGHVLCAIDLGPDSERVLGWASWFANGFGARISTIFVAPFLEGSTEDGFDPRWRLDLTLQARSKINKLQNEVGVKGELLIEGGDDVPRAVCSAAARLQADVMVIGRSAPGQFLGRLRTNSYAIIRESPCPVISV